MADSRFQTTQYSAEHFVESAGAILFEVATRRICLIHHKNRDEWLLAKGRRNVGESRAKAALRESQEETGFICDLLPITLMSRAPPAVEEPDQHYPDESRTHTGVTEPFMLTCRQLEGDNSMKMIWWYIAVIRQSTEGKIVQSGAGEEDFSTALFAFDEAVNKLTYRSDQDVLKKAIGIFEVNY